MRLRMRSAVNARTKGVVSYLFSSEVASENPKSASMNGKEDEGSIKEMRELFDD